MAGMPAAKCIRDCSKLADVNVIFDRGIYLADRGLWLDGRVRREEGYISHAHADHVARHSSALLTPGTERLLRPLLKNTRCHTLEYGEPLETSSYILCLYPAGHCLGSAQVLVTIKRTGERVLYTGDFKIVPNPTAEAVQPVECDTLIMEATFGQPCYTFPPQGEVLERCYAILHAWLSAGRTPLLPCYRVGKAQEVLHLLLSAGFEVALESSAFQVAEVYQEAGVRFPGPFSLVNGSPKEGQVVLCPPSRARFLAPLIPGRRTLMLTGWAANPASRRWFHADEVLPFSDHADFSGLLDYVSAVKPKRVFTVYGFPQLAARLRELGYEATHLEGRATSRQLSFF